MATTAWIRTSSTANAWTTAQTSLLLGKFNSGTTILRSHLAWGFGGYAWTRFAPTSTMGNVMTLGMVTTIGNGSETPPDPVSQSGNQAEPSQRWLWWQVRAPEVRVWDSANNNSLWQSSPPEEDSSTKGQVLAPSTMGVGNTLNLWLTWKALALWDPSGQAILWVKTSTLYRTP